MTKTKYNKAHFNYIPFHPKSLMWMFANAFMRVTFKRKVRDIRHTIQLRKQWDKGSSFVKLKNGVRCEPYCYRGIKGEWILPKTKPTSLILYLHGGGYCLGSMTTHRAFLTYLSDFTNAKIFHLDYRLAPEFPFPAALNDAIEAYSWLMTQKQHLPFFIVGDSAGGGLALATLLALRDRKFKLPHGTICFSPWTDLTHQGETFKTNQESDNLLYGPSLPVVAQLYIGGSDPTHPYLSPVYGDYSEVSPIFIQASNNEILLSDSMRIYENVKKVNGSITLEVWENVFHAWIYTASFLPESRQALFHVRQFMEGF